MFDHLFFSKFLAVYETVWKNIIEPDRPQMRIWRMCTECSIPKATNAHSEYVISFPLESDFKNAPQYYVIRTVHFLSLLLFRS
jgi:hypothetical protein